MVAPYDLKEHLWDYLNLIPLFKMLKQSVSLWQIERAIRPCFQWDKSSNKRLQIKRRMYGKGSLGIARTVVIGIASSYGIEPWEIACHLDIKQKGIPIYLDRYLYAHSREAKTVIQEVIVLKASIVKRFISQYFHLKEVI